MSRTPVSEGWMRLAAFYAGLVLNAVYMQYILMPRPGLLAAVLGAMIWGVFLLFGVYLVPARTGMGPKTLIDAQLGRWVGALVWWVILPVWAISWFKELTAVFTGAVHTPLFRWEEVNRISVDTTIAVYWPWIVLSGLAGLNGVEKVSFPVRVSLVILGAAPFAYRDSWPDAARYLGGLDCCAGLWGMQVPILWLTPALLFAGLFEVRSIRWGVVGIVIPMIGASVIALGTYAGAAVESIRVYKTANYYVAVAGGGPEWKIKTALLALTVLAAGRFCVALLSERLGEWRRWWVIFPMIAALVWVVPLPSRLEWQLASMPLVALAGVMSAGYLHRRSFTFAPVEQRWAAVAWVCGSTFGIAAYFSDETLPFGAWFIGFALAWAAMKVVAIEPL